MKEPPHVMVFNYGGEPAIENYQDQRNGGYVPALVM